MSQLSVYKEAELLAEGQRKSLELGDAPIKDIFALLEGQGIFVVRMPMESDSLSGAFYYDKETATARILVNNNRTPGHQRFTAAHEFCHFLLDKENYPEIIEEDKGEKPLFEKRADSFAANFLMPKNGVDFYVRQVLKKKTSRLEDLDIVKIKYEYGSSWSFTVYRLHDLGYTFDKPYSEKVKDSKHFNFLAGTMNFEPEWPQGKEGIMLPADYYRLAFNAYFKDKISLNRLAEILRVSYDDAKDWVAEIRQSLKDDGGSK